MQHEKRPVQERFMMVSLDLVLKKLKRFRRMNAAHKTLFAGVLSMVFLGTALAHETPGISHSHAFKQSSYGVYRQGHSVNNRNGSITIWSAKPHTGYKPGEPVRFARPQPMTTPPATIQGKPAPMKKPESDSIRIIKPPK
jgi:hypothetical protein